MRHLLLSALLLALAGSSVSCVDEAPPPEETPSIRSSDQPADSPDAGVEPMSVRITAPADGATVAGPGVLVALEASGLEIVPAGDDRPASGHHHLIVNADLPAMDAPIPNIAGQYIHLGAAQTEFELTDLAPGEYQVIALVGDFAHVPLDPPVADTVRFVVQR